MDHASMEFGEVHLSFANSAADGPRAERIARLTFEYVQEVLESTLSHLSSNVVIEHLEVPVIEVSFETMDDETIARASAAGIYRALLQAL